MSSTMATVREILCSAVLDTSSRACAHTGGLVSDGEELGVLAAIARYPFVVRPRLARVDVRRESSPTQLAGRQLPLFERRLRVCSRFGGQNSEIKTTLAHLHR